MEIRVSPKVGVAEGSRRDHLERGTMTLAFVLHEKFWSSERREI